MSRGFRLATVQRLRARHLDDAGRALAEARRALAEATARRDLLRARHGGCVPAGRTPAEVGGAARHRELLRERIAAADDEIAQLTLRAGQARDAWLAARGDLRAVEALHDRFRAATRREQDRREQRLVDDLAAARHRVSDHRDDHANDRVAGEAGEPA